MASDRLSPLPGQVGPPDPSAQPAGHHARRHGASRRDFLRTTAGTVTLLGALSQVFGCSDAEVGGDGDGSGALEGFIVPTPEAIGEMLNRLPDAPFVMLDLFRIREVPDYSAHPELAPAIPVSGRELFERYAADMERHLAEIGAARVFLADGGPCLIGPSNERWDAVQMVRFPSPRAFLALATNQEVIDGLPHRFAILEDSRVFPMAERPLR